MIWPVRPGTRGMPAGVGYPESMSHIYEIRVEEELDPRWSHRFEGMVVSPVEAGSTRLLGPVRDQAELHGLLLRIRDLGLTLISVQVTRHETLDISPASKEARP